MGYGDGCIPVYSGLIDLMTDNENEDVLGHVSLGHSRKVMQTAYVTLAAHDALFATSGVAVQLFRTQLGDLAKDIINSVFSSSQESDSDDFSHDLLKNAELTPRA